MTLSQFPRINGGLGQLGVSGRRAAVTPWWLSGGVSAANAIAVYQPIGAASLAASYTNLANPGTFDAAPGVAPTWSAVDGWIFGGSPQRLTTGYTPTVPQAHTALIRFSDVTSVGGRWLFGAQSGGIFGIQPKDDQATPNVAYLSGFFVRVNPQLLSGVLGISGNQGFRNGTAEGTITNAGNVGVPIFLGAVNAGGSPGGYITAKIQAFAIYTPALTAPQVAAISAAMAAL
jgi:hypothetical protein